MKLSFVKMHGLGNDFVVLDGISREVTISEEIVRRLANRKVGIGCDQLLLVEPPKADDADFLYRIFNADGTEVEQCGNGARCVAKFLVDRKLSPKKQIVLQTKSGRLRAEVLDDERVSVDMGEPEFDPEKIPALINISEGILHEVKLITGEQISFAAVSIGNPHAVIFVEDVDKAEVSMLGSAIQQSELFPKGVNVSFCRALGKDRMRLRVYERGVGETMACGSGACAAVAIGQKLNWLKDRVSVQLTGGTLEVDSSGGTLKLTGPATQVFESVIDFQESA